MSDPGDAGNAEQRRGPDPGDRDAPGAAPPPGAVPAPDAAPDAASADRATQPPHDLWPTVDPPSADVEAGAVTSVLPGAHRGGFARLFTAPVGIAQDAPSAGPPPEWAPAEPPRLYRGIAGWALGVAIVGLIASLFVGWGFPVGLVGMVTAIVSLRRPIESRAVGVWALVLSSVSLIYSAGWLIWAAIQLQHGAA